jgi:formate-dependent nitrite reductase cytochrome c552 subunit
VLLCGPITRELYDIADQELAQKLPQYSAIATAKYPRILEIDRLGIHATRVQIETLTEDLRDAEEQLAMTQQSLETYRQKVLQDFQSLQDRVDSELQAQLRKQAEGYENRMKIMQETLVATEAENVKLCSKIAHRLPVLWSPRGILAKGSGADAEKKIVKLQARARAFVARKKYLRTRTYVSAKQSGVLVAVQGTQQGDTGWYVEPNGGIFYFVLVKVRITSHTLPGFRWCLFVWLRYV